MACELIAASYNLVFVDQISSRPGAMDPPSSGGQGLTAVLHGLTASIPAPGSRALKMSQSRRGIPHDFSGTCCVYRITSYQQRYAGDISKSRVKESKNRSWRT